MNRSPSSGDVFPKYVGPERPLRGKEIIAAVLWVFFATHGMAQEHQHADGETLGNVQFATSCNKPAQSEVNRAVALLHSFQFSRAIEGFNAALREDPTCAIAYWGIALSDWSNPFAPGQKDKGQLKLGLQSAEQGKKLGANTERERAYLTAVGKLYGDFEGTPQQARLLAYRDAMGNVAANYPDDPEAQIFYALALAVAEDPADKTYADRLKAGAREGASALPVTIWSGACGTAQREDRCEQALFCRTPDGLRTLRQTWKVRDQGST
jgi:hypothetical protein